MAQRRAKQILEESGLNYKQWEDMIDLWIFNAKHREMLKAYLLDGVSYEDLAEMHNYSVNHVKDIIYQGEKRLFSKIE